MALELVGLSDRKSHRPGQLSGGQQQRVGNRPGHRHRSDPDRGDEPTGDLDARSADEILNLMCELQQGLAKTISW